MIKRILLICILLTGLSSFAEEVPVTITPIQKISTGDKHLKEGDTVDFTDVNTGEEITGIIKELTPNGFAIKYLTEKYILKAGNTKNIKILRITELPRLQ